MGFNLRSDKMYREHPSCTTIPWLDIAKTPAFWAVMASHVSFTYGLYTLIALLPTFYNDVMHMNISKNGAYSALPYICFAVISVSSGPLADFLISRRILSLTAVRKIMDGLGHILPFIFLLLTTVIGCSVTAAGSLLCLSVGTQALVGAGSFANNMDFAGRFAGITFGIINTIASIGGVVAPLIAGAITEHDNTVYGWRIVFGIAAGFNWISALVFFIFTSGQPAEWALIEQKPQRDTDDAPKDATRKDVPETGESGKALEVLNTEVI